MGFWAVFRSLVSWIDLILHIVILLNISHYVTRLTGHEGSVKAHKEAFLNDPINQKKRYLAFFLSLGPRMDLVLHIMID